MPPPRKWFPDPYDGSEQTDGATGRTATDHHLRFRGDLPAEMNKLASQLPEYPVAMDMYAVGQSLGHQLMAEIGDVTRFARKQSLVAFAGVEPMPDESGDKKSRSSKTSKRGSPYLRKALFNVVDVYIRTSPLPKFKFFLWGSDLPRR